MSTGEPGQVDGASDERVDELRQRLRSLGYLDAGVNRFVLGVGAGDEDARDARGARRRSHRPAVGAAARSRAAAGLGAAHPGLVSSARDALVLAVYLGALFFLATAILSAGVSLIASAFVRAGGERSTLRARRASRLAAWSTTIVCLAYLTLWWRAGSTAFAWNTPVWTAIALATAAIVSLLLGHAVPDHDARGARSGHACVAAARLDTIVACRPRRRRRSRFSRRRVADLHGAVCGRSSHRVHPPLDGRVRRAARPARRHRRLRHRKRLPHRRAGPARSAAGPPWPHSSRRTRRIPPARGRQSPRAVSADVHGVAGIETRRVAGVQGTIGAEGGAVGRIVRDGDGSAAPDATVDHEPRGAACEDALGGRRGSGSAHGRHQLVGHLARDGHQRNGIVITDRAVLRLERGGPLDAEIAPPDAVRAVASIVAGAPRTCGFGRGTMRSPRSTDSEVAVVLRRSAELDGTIVGLLNALPGPRRDLDVIYLPGLDIAQHTLLASNQGAALPPSAMAARIDGLRAYYRFLDEMLAPVVARSADDIVMVVTQPGRVRSSIGGLMAISDGGVVDGQGPAAGSRKRVRCHAHGDGRVGPATQPRASRARQLRRSIRKALDGMSTRTGSRTSSPPLAPDSHWIKR